MTRARIYKVAGRLIDLWHAATGGNFVPSSGQNNCSPLLPLPALRKTLSGVERTSRSHRKMFAFEPYATLAVHCGNGFDAGFSSQSIRLCR
jgi:hypothetical protein